MQPILNDVLARRRDRGIAIILGMKERECDKYLPKEISGKLRKVILDQFNEFYEICVDVMRSLDTGDVTLNEHYVERIEEKLDTLHLAVLASSNGHA